MGIKERREREKQDVRQRILDAARDLFVRDGYEAVTMRKVAEAIEYSPTALYLHFADKEALLRALCDQDFLALAKAFQRIAKESDPVERLRKIGHAYVDFALEHPNHYRLMFMTPKPVKVEPACAAGEGNVEEDAYSFLRGSVVEAIAAGRLRPELKDPDVVAQALWSGTHGVAALQIVMTGDPNFQMCPAKKVASLVIDAALAGMTRTRKE
jgi:AcrR family transcriptional regulator